MTDKQADKPSCFCDLEKVFPLGKDGLRHTQKTCMPCRYKTECLKTAMNDEHGLKFQEEMVDRAYRLKRISFFDRWSKKKYFQKMQQQKKYQKKEAGNHNSE